MKTIKNFWIHLIIAMSVISINSFSYSQGINCHEAPMPTDLYHPCIEILNKINETHKKWKEEDESLKRLKEQRDASEDAILANIRLVKAEGGVALAKSIQKIATIILQIASPYRAIIAITQIPKILAAIQQFLDEVRKILEFINRIITILTDECECDILKDWKTFLDSVLRLQESLVRQVYLMETVRLQEIVVHDLEEEYKSLIRMEHVYARSTKGGGFMYEVKIKNIPPIFIFKLMWGDETNNCTTGTPIPCSIEEVGIHLSDEQKGNIEYITKTPKTFFTEWLCTKHHNSPSS